MNNTLNLAIAGVFASIIVGAATPAWGAPENQMSGHYIDTETNTATGQSSTHDWYFTPCGSGCADVALNGPNNRRARAQLANGQWKMDAAFDTTCTNGTSVPGSLIGHYVWDATTLAGTAQLTYSQAACGNQPGTTNVNLQLKPAT